MALSIDGAQSHLILFELFSDFLDGQPTQHSILPFTPITESELRGAPVSLDFLQVDLNLLLFFGRLSNFFDFFRQLQDLSLGEILNREDFGLVVWNSVGGAALLVKGFPVTVLDGVFLENGDQREDLL